MSETKVTKKLASTRKTSRGAKVVAEKPVEASAVDKEKTVAEKATKAATPATTKAAATKAPARRTRKTTTAQAETVKTEAVKAEAVKAEEKTVVAVAVDAAAPAKKTSAKTPAKKPAAKKAAVKEEGKAEMKADAPAKVSEEATSLKIEVEMPVWDAPVADEKAAEKASDHGAEKKRKTPEMTPEMLASFGKKAKEKKASRTLAGDKLDAKGHSGLGETTLVTLADFLAKHETPIIPIYQRVNGWTLQQKTTFREAVERLIDHPEAEPFFIGTISVARARGTTRCYVIDGQQRLSTLHELFRGAFPLERHNGLSRSQVTIAPFEIKAKTEMKSIFDRIVFVLHDYGEIDLEEQILAFDELNRHEEAYRLADRYRATMLSALPESEHRHFAAVYDEAWRLSTVLFRLANHEDYELSFDLPDQERPAERPSLFRLQTPAEIEARIAPSGTPRPYIPVAQPEDKSLLPLRDPLPALSAEELEDEEPLVSVREPIVRERGIVTQIRGFLKELETPLDSAEEHTHLMTNAFLETTNVFEAQRELDYADHLSTKAKYFAFLCYLRVANPNGRVPVAWADAFGRTVSGGIEKLLPVKEGTPLTERAAKRILQRLQHNNNWVRGLLAAYRGRLEVASDAEGKAKTATPSAGDTWLAIIRFLGDGWLQLADAGESPLAVQMMDAGTYLAPGKATQFWHTLETWAKRNDATDEDTRKLVLRARECVLYRALVGDVDSLTDRLTTTLANAKSLAKARGDAKTEKRLAAPEKVAKKVVAFMRENTLKRTLPAALNDGALEAWLTRELVEVEGRVTYATLAKLSNLAFVDTRTAQTLGEIHPDVKAAMLTAGLKRAIPWPNLLLLVALQNVFAGEKEAAGLSQVVDLAEAFWAQ